MHDLLLWRLLGENPLPAARVIPLLRQLAALPLRDRFPFFGRLSRALKHTDVSLRAAAAATLAGAHGPLGWTWLVAALNDPAEEVRLAVVPALRESAMNYDSLRWTHALFQADPAVRERAVRESSYVEPWRLLYLLPDPSCADAVLSRMPPAPTMPPMALPMVLEFAGRNLIPHGLARALVASLPMSDLLFWMGRGAARTPEQVGRLLETAERMGTTDGISSTPDCWDELVNLFWEEDFRLPSGGQFLENLLNEALAGYEEPWSRRVLASLFVTLLQRGDGRPRVLAELAARFPHWLGSTWVTAPVRRQILTGLYERGATYPQWPEAVIRPICSSDVFRRDSGLDLWAIGAVLHLLEGSPYQSALAWFGQEFIVDSFLDDIEGSAPFLRLRDNSEGGRRLLIREMYAQAGGERSKLLACLVQVVQADALDFLDPLDGKSAAVLVAELLRRRDEPGLKPGSTKARRVGDILGRKIAAGHVADFLKVWLDAEAPHRFDLGLQILSILARNLEGHRLLGPALALEPAPLKKYLQVVVFCAGYPYDGEIELAAALKSHADEAVRAWALARLPKKPAAPKWLRPPDGLRRGLCADLATRGLPDGPSIDICLALLGSHDPPAEVDAQLARFGSTAPEFLSELDQAMIEVWRGEARLPLAGHAWLYRWDDHTRACLALLRDRPNDLDRTWLFTPLGERVWAAVARQMDFWHWQDRPRLVELAGDATFVEQLLRQLRSNHGPHVAAILMRLRQAAPGEVERYRARVVSEMPYLAGSLLAIFSPWIDSYGLAPAPLPTTPAPTCTPAVGVDGDATISAERLLGFGERGALALLQRLREEAAGRPAHALALAEVLARWPKLPSLAGAVEAVEDAALPPHVRFVLGLPLLKRHRRKVLPLLFEAACQETEDVWFQKGHWDVLVARGVSAVTVAIGLATSPHTPAYVPAVQALLGQSPPRSAVRHALLAFLGCGTQRMAELRLGAARALTWKNKLDVFPLLLAAEQGNDLIDPYLFRGLSPEQVEQALTAGLVAGPNALTEIKLLCLLQGQGVHPTARDDGYRRLLVEGNALDVKDQVKPLLKRGMATTRKLNRVAQTFAWGVRKARELTGKMFQVEMLVGQDLGYTYYDQNIVFVNALPLIRDEPAGEDIVQGLILHELGHHLYHADPESRAVWKEAQTEGLQRLLNLVSDEHLERNLRARDREYGNKLKRLGAYAFLHSRHEVHVDALLSCLQGRAFEVLSATRLGAARNDGAVAVENGRVLLEMEKAGMSFARFVRAMRMGLGNRHGDPKVTEGLALFKGEFRRSTMPQMREIARRLREIFGWETGLLDALGQDLALGSPERETLGEGVSNDEVQQRVKRILSPPKKGDGQPREPGGGQCINVGPDADFNEITQVIHVPFDPQQHAHYAAQVQRPARQMRRYFEKLGLAMETERARLRGRQFDRTRIQALVQRNDPRLLIARQLRRRNDLFLGIVIDCSGSMASGDSMEKARLFGTLLAEAARGQPGIDLRIFGFTDREIFDAGDAARCAAHGLQATAGNNDAAGLWHAAKVALRSRRKARLLVMISDGLPTECTVAALRGLVQRLTRRWKICCAQVAVRPLEEMCFDHYVLLEENDLDACVRRFGATVARLIRKAMGG